VNRALNQVPVFLCFSNKPKRGEDNDFCISAYLKLPDDGSFHRLSKGDISAFFVKEDYGKLLGDSSLIFARKVVKMELQNTLFFKKTCAILSRFLSIRLELIELKWDRVS
jgi:hypothetical protein|tara:strand:- start:961 stop:1290 length:330 start_codon:yes stop_codon:yes gene_type:complete